MNTVKEMRLETERLVIRPYVQEDLMDCFNLMQDKELFDYLDMDVMSFEDYKGLFNWLIDSYGEGFDADFKYSFNIILKESGKHIGWIGIGRLDYDIKQKEIYYLIGREHQGKGYAKEASAAILDYGFNEMGLKEVVGLFNPQNIASKKVIENLGLKFDYIVSGLPEEFDYYNNEPHYSITKEEYLSKKRLFRIECKDIVLREFALADLGPLYNLTLQKEIIEFLPDWGGTKEQRRYWLVNDHMVENRKFLNAVPNINGEGLILGIILKETGEFIGWCGTYPKDELPPPNREIFYAISKDYRGRGFTTQAAQGIINYLFENTNVDELSAIALLHNIPSNRVIQKCGFKPLGTIEVEGEDFNYYKLFKNENKVR